MCETSKFKNNINEFLYASSLSLSFSRCALFTPITPLPHHPSRTVSRVCFRTTNYQWEFEKLNVRNRSNPCSVLRTMFFLVNIERCNKSRNLSWNSTHARYLVSSAERYFYPIAYVYLPGSSRQLWFPPNHLDRSSIHGCICPLRSCHGLADAASNVAELATACPSRDSQDWWTWQ